MKLQDGPCGTSPSLNRSLAATVSWVNSRAAIHFTSRPRCKLLFSGNTLPLTAETDTTAAFVNRFGCCYLIKVSHEISRIHCCWTSYGGSGTPSSRLRYTLLSSLLNITLSSPCRTTLGRFWTPLGYAATFWGRSLMTAASSVLVHVSSTRTSTGPLRISVL